MVYNEELVERVRAILGVKTDFEEKKMFGGVSFMVHGHMTVGVNKDDLVIRVGPDKHEVYLREKFARPMDFTGKSMKGMIYISIDGLKSDKDLVSWIDRSLEFVTSLPSK